MRVASATCPVLILHPEERFHAINHHQSTVEIIGPACVPGVLGKIRKRLRHRLRVRGIDYLAHTFASEPPQNRHTFRGAKR